MKKMLSLIAAAALASCVVPASTPQRAPAPQPQPQPQPQPPPATTPPPVAQPTPPPRPQHPTPPPRPEPPVSQNPSPPPPPPPTTPVEPLPPKWDANGWTLLAERGVNGRRDRDVVNLRKRGAFTHLTFVVSGADVEMNDVVITFGNNETFSPKLKHYFRNGSRTRAINLPGHRRNIKKIEFLYGNTRGLLRGRARARVAVYGLDKSPKPQAPSWKPAGWTRLGERWVNGRRDADALNLRNKGAYTHLTVVVSQGDLRMWDMEVVFGNGEKYSPNLKHIFRNGSRSQAINLPGYQRNIKTVRFKYGNLAYAGRAKVTVWGLSKAAKPTPPTWKPQGWTRLGERWVNGRRDKDALSVRNKGAFTHLMLVVSESDLRMFDMEVTFGNGKKFSPTLKHLFKNGARSRKIDLPGHQRNIRNVKFKYGNLPGTGRAKVALYGINKAPKPSKPSWKPDGWVRLGQKWVNGRRDKDVINVGRKRVGFTALTLVVADSDLRMEDLVVTFGNRQKFSPKLRHIFKNGSRSRKIDLPGNVRNIRRIAFKYGNLPGTGRASVTVWGKPGAVGPDDKPPTTGGSDWTAKGWSKLGARFLAANRNADAVNVGKYAKQWGWLAMEANGGDIYIKNVIVTFGNGQTWSPGINQVFKKGRSRTIQLPKKRKIKNVRFQYGGKERAGRPTITIYGK